MESTCGDHMLGQVMRSCWLLGWTERQRDRQEQRQTDRQTDGQEQRLTDRQTDRQESTVISVRISVISRGFVK